MRTYLLAGIVALAGITARAEVVDRIVDYKDGDAVLEGRLFVDNEVEGRKPTVVVFHQWGGPGAHETGVARRLAEEGYAAFVADVYGKGVRPADTEARMAETAKYRSNRDLMRSRARAALDVLRIRETVDTERIVAIGFCFGGTVALELARSGAPLAGVISVHGGLDTPAPDATRVRCPVLVVMGDRDPDFPDPAAEAALVADALHGTAVVVPEAGHYPHAERPDLVADVVLPFLAAHARG